MFDFPLSVPVGLGSREEIRRNPLAKTPYWVWGLTPGCGVRSNVIR